METKDIIQIIKAAKANGVDRLTYGELVISFASHPEPTKEISPELPIPVKVPAVVEKRQDEITLEMNKRNEVVDAEDEMAEMLINDPGKYEELMTTGELVDEPRIQH